MVILRTQLPVERPPPTIAAAAGDQDVRRRGLPWAWAEGVQTVEGVLAAVAWWGKRVTALRVPAVDVTAVPDAALRALCLLCFLDIKKKCRISSRHLQTSWSHFLLPSFFYLSAFTPSSSPQWPLCSCVCTCNMSVQLMEGGGKAFPVCSKTSCSWPLNRLLCNSQSSFKLSIVFPTKLSWNRIFSCLCLFSDIVHHSCSGQEDICSVPEFSISSRQNIFDDEDSNLQNAERALRPSPFKVLPPSSHS